VNNPSTCSCTTGFLPNGTQCKEVCGDGLVVGVEVCDDKTEGGCVSNCSASE
jgi:hypothetical protein